MTSTRNFIISLVMILIWAAVLLFFAIRFYQKQLSKKMICSWKRKVEGTILACRLFLFQFISLNPAIYPKNKGTI